MKKYVVLGIFICGPFVTSLSSANSGSEGVGGGNTLGGKMIEHYYRDFSSIPGSGEAFVDVLEKIILQDSTENGCVNAAKRMKNEINSIIWYLIPTTFKEQSQHITGLPFQSDQLAVTHRISSSSAEVFIDETMFAKLNNGEKTTLFIHELEMARQLMGRRPGSSTPSSELAGMARNSTIGFLKWCVK